MWSILKIGPIREKEKILILIGSGGGILILFLVFRPWEGGPLLYLFLGVSAVLIFGFLYHYIAPKRYFIANRQTGMLKQPTSEKKEAIWVAFADGFGFEKTVYASSFY
ncbi:hypothetical protein JL102_23420, partial [Fulvivirga sp. 2943]|nr:hypothetical protein [Fulvivirga sediminis]